MGGIESRGRGAGSALSRRGALGLGALVAGLALAGCGQAAGFAPESGSAASTSAPLPDIGLAIGDRFPDFKVESLAGGTLSLASYAGRPLFVNFWATWCGPCRIELPEMEAIWASSEFGDLAIIAISVGERRDTVETFVTEEIPLTFDVGIDPSGRSNDQYNIIGMPTSYFLDTRGVIKDVNIGGMNRDLLVRRISTIADPV